MREEDLPGAGRPPADVDGDSLLEPTVRRIEVPGDPILVRRAEKAEAAAQALEEHLSRIQARLEEAERECEQASRGLGEREEQLRLASERLASGERELHLVTSRLSEREEEVRVVSARLAERERELQQLTERLLVREADLRRAEIEIKRRLDGLEERVVEVQRELTDERTAREGAERELEEVRAALRRTEGLVGELKELAHRLRGALTSTAATAAVPGAPAPPDSHAASPAAPVASEAATASPPAGPTAVAAGTSSSRQGGQGASDAAEEQARRAQMADALASAVERLRARVAAVGEMHDSRAWASEQEQQLGSAPSLSARSVEQRGRGALSELGAASPFIPAPAEASDGASNWLAGAIRRLAEHRDPRLAAELVLEILPAQAKVIPGRLRYLARIAEIGQYAVTLAGGEGSASPAPGRVGRRSAAFVLEGSAASFAEVAAGGASGVPPAGLRIARGRRRARRLFQAMHAPVSLAQLQRAGISIWPGLLLAAFVESIDPAWTAGERVGIGFLIEAQTQTRLYLQINDGQPPALSRVALDADLELDVNVRAAERAFMAMFAGEKLPEGCEVLLEGEITALQRLLAWTDRVQGIRRLHA